MHFVPSAEPSSAALPAPRDWRLALFASAAIAALASTQPWIRARFAGLWGDHVGPPAWQSTTGFTCLCTAALVAVMALAETGSQTTQRAVRPGSLMLAGLATLLLVVELCAGPGMLRDLTAAWTYAFWLAAIGVPALLFVCAMRCAPRTGGRYSSSGPPT